MFKSAEIIRCPMGHVLNRVMQIDFACHICDRDVASDDSFVCNEKGCDFDVCSDCASKCLCPNGHLFTKKRSDSNFECGSCFVQKSGVRLCCKDGECDLEICDECSQKRKCPAKHLFFRLNTGVNFSCDICNKENLTGDRLCCKRADCDFDICLDCSLKATCPSGHFLKRVESDRKYQCDVCSMRLLRNVRLCCKLDGCDYDICSTCIEKAHCPEGHFLRRRNCEKKFICDICGSKWLNGLRLCCKCNGCDYDICIPCVAAAKCSSGHFLRRHQSDDLYDCDICPQQGLSGSRLRCRAEGCNFDMCTGCIQSALLAPRLAAVTVTSQTEPERMVDVRAMWQGDGYAKDKLFSVELDSEEAGVITALFRRSMHRSTIETLERVENGAQFDLHSVYVSNVKRALGDDFDVVTMVRLLFHGTSTTNAQSIVRSDTAGFLPLLAGTASGAEWGDGTYFARDAVFSHRYAVPLPCGQRQMLVSQVVVGRWVKGQKGLKACPPLPGSYFQRFNSLVDREDLPSIFVIQDTGQAYPAYLITYH